MARSYHGSAASHELHDGGDGGALTDRTASRTSCGMAKKSATDTGASLRGVKLVKKAIEAGKSEALASPEPVAAAVIKKLVLPNGEPITASMKELLKVDGLWLGIEFDEDEGDIEAVSFEDLVEDNYGGDALPLFAEASELFGGDCIVVGGAADSVRFLYVGEPDESGEYPVMSLRKEPEPWVGGFVPFDVWLAQELGALPSGEAAGLAPAYEEAIKALAEANGDGRVGFKPEAGEGREDDEEDDDEEDDDDDDTGADAESLESSDDDEGSDSDDEDDEDADDQTDR